MNSISKKDNKCFQDIIKVTLNREKIKKKLQRITKLKPFINKYNWERTNFSSKADDQKKFEKCNPTSALNVLYVKKEKKYISVFQNITQIIKKPYYFNDFIQRKMALS